MPTHLSAKPTATTTETEPTRKDMADGPIFTQIAVIGAGTMGTGIALAFANAGYPVVLLDRSDDALASGFARIDALHAQSLRRGKIDEATMKAARNLIQGTTDYQDLSTADLVIEAAFERMDIKQEIFRTLDQVCKDGAVLATNTSYLDVAEIAHATARPQAVFGLHFFSPAHIMKLVEVVQTDMCDPAIVATLGALMTQIGKIAVITGNGFGFIGNRMYQAYQREAGLMLLQGATPHQIDTALQSFGMAMGPFAVMDLSGLDIGYLMRQSLPEGRTHPHAFQVHDQLVNMGRTGRKAGAGFYHYQDGTPSGADDPDVLALISDTAARLNYSARAYTDAMIVETCLSALATEGNAILRDGIARCASDIDVVFVNGYGFPRAKGGPMSWRHQVL